MQAPLLHNSTVPHVVFQVVTLSARQVTFSQSTACFFCCSPLRSSAQVLCTRKHAVITADCQHAVSSVGVAAEDDDDVDSVSPRTLKQAADRLAQFTSDEPAGLPPLLCMLICPCTCMTAV